MKGLIEYFVLSARSLRDLVFPRRCVVCQDPLSVEERDLCIGCFADLPLTFFWSSEGNPAEVRMRERVGIEQAVSLYFYRKTGGFSHIIHNVKYRGRIDLGERMGAILGNYMKGSGRFAAIDGVVPVPLHFSRKWKRGYNQAEIIAQGIASELGEKPVICNLLKRSKRTKTQTKLSGEAKRKNVSNAFNIDSKTALKLQETGIKHILIVDDVLTTGSTLEACITPLLPYFKVSVATLGFVE